MNRITGLLLLILLVSTPFLVVAQIHTFPSTPGNNPQQLERQTDEALANAFMQQKEYDKAFEVFDRLFKKYPTQYYYSGCLNALIQLNRLKEAEQLVRQQMRGQRNEIQLNVDLAYVYLVAGDRNRSQRTIDQLIDNLPADQNRINIAANALRVRNFDTDALRVYEKASQMPTLANPFYLEKAGLYQTIGDYDKSIDEYLKQLDYQPEHFELIKNRLSTFMFTDTDHQMAELIRTKLLKQSQSAPDDENISRLLIWLFLQENDYDLAIHQAKALDRRFGDRDALILDLADIALTNQQFAPALDGYRTVAAKGPKGAFYFRGKVNELRTRYYLAEFEHITDRLVYRELSSDIDQLVVELGRNTETNPLAVVQSQILAYKLQQEPEAITLLEKSLLQTSDPMQKNEIKMYLADIMLFTNDVWEATLLYSQIDKELKNEPMAHEARFRNARLRYFIGEYGWAQSLLNVLKAATSKLIANDALELTLTIGDFLKEDTTGASLIAFGAADLLVYRKQNNEAAFVLDTLLKNPAYAALQPYFYMRKAEIAENKSDNKLADSLYTQIYQRFSTHFLSDDALMRDAQLKETKLRQNSQAMELYEKLMEEYPSSIFAVEARRKFRILRGDEGASSW